MHGFPRSYPPSSWVNDPAKMPEYKWEYYRSTWGFDPFIDLVEMDEEDAGYYYEVYLPLENDPDLKNAGVQMVARVELEEDGESRNRLGFERRTKRSFVECIHTAVYVATPEELAEFSPEDYESLVASTEGRPALLPPWEHFASLKSFAAGLVDRGILATLFPPSGDTDNKDFDAQGLGISGINDQLISVLYYIAPKIVESRVMQHVGEIIERAPEDWIITHAEALSSRYKLELLFQNEAYLASVDNATMKKLLILCPNLERKEGYEGVDDIDPDLGDDDITDKKQGEKKGKAK